MDVPPKPPGIRLWLNLFVFWYIPSYMIKKWIAVFTTVGCVFQSITFAYIWEIYLISAFPMLIAEMRWWVLFLSSSLCSTLGLLSTLCTQPVHRCVCVCECMIMWVFACVWLIACLLAAAATAAVARRHSHTFTSECARFIKKYDVISIEIRKSALVDSAHIARTHTSAHWNGELRVQLPLHAAPSSRAYRVRVCVCGVRECDCFGISMLTGSPRQTLRSCLGMLSVDFPTYTHTRL